MARKTINQLTELTEISGNDELAVYDTSTSSTKKITKENLIDKSPVTSVTGSGDAGCNFIAHKKNGVVTVWLYTTKAITATTHNYGTLPVGYRPYRIMRVVGSTGNTTNVDVYGNITDGGLISLINSTVTTEAKYTIATATFIAEN